MYDVSETDVSELVAESFRCSHLVLAAPTYNGGLYPRMESFLADVKALSLQKRTVALLENGTWAPVAAKHMRAVLEGMKEMTVLEGSVAIKSALGGEPARRHGGTGGRDRRAGQRISQTDTACKNTPPVAAVFFGFCVRAARLLHRIEQTQEGTML